MQDRELLERAAKAAGKTLADPIDSYIPSGGLWVIGRKGMDEVWNPLTNDGDALRLAVKLKMGVEMSGSGCEVRFDDQKGDEGCLVQDLGDDGSLSELQAARRAIVRAAAEIGKTK